MITIYLLFRLTAGSLDEVDAFKDLESCQAYQVAIEGQLESAKQQMPPHGRGLFAKTSHDVQQNQMGKWRDRTEALHAGNRTRTAKAFATDGTPSLWWRITDQLRPIEIGVTNRIRTGTNAFTGRDAAVTS